MARTGEVSLADGRVTRLAGIDWPARAEPGNRERAWQAVGRLGENAQAALALATSPDRWGRIGAQLYLHSSGGPPEAAWVQGTLLALGLVRYWPEAVAQPCRLALLREETRAREARIGLWSPFAGRLRAAALRRKGGTEAEGRLAYEGLVRSVREGRGVLFVNFAGKREKTPFMMISKRDLAAYRKEGLDPATFSGKRLRVRGVVSRTPSLRLDVSGPLAVEVLE